MEKESIDSLIYTPNSPKKGLNEKSDFIETEYGKLHFVTLGNQKKPTLFLIHGSPGNWTNWKSVLYNTNLLDNYFVVAIDRVQYNATTIKEFQTLENQSKILAPLMETYCNPCFIIGHSYGGGLALQLAADYPQFVSGISSVAGTIAAPYQKRRWYNYLAKYTFIYFLINKDLKSSNREMWHLRSDLKKLETKLKTIKCSIALIQGKKDFIVSPKSIEYIAPLLTNARVKIYDLPKGNHFLIWNDIPTVLQSINWLSKEKLREVCE